MSQAIGIGLTRVRTLKGQVEQSALTRRRYHGFRWIESSTEARHHHIPRIPKCGGTTIKSQVDTSKLEVLFDYDQPPQYRECYRDQCARCNKEFSRLNFGEFDLVFGHFPVERHSAMDWLRVVLLRHPVDRENSHYFYYKNQLPDTNALALSRDPITTEIKAGSAGIVDFVQRTEMRNFLANYPGESEPDDFVLVGFTQNYNEFCLGLGNLAGVPIDSQQVLRKGDRENLSIETQSQLESILRDDIELYETYRAAE